jgi:hypothetical protein
MQKGGNMEELRYPNLSILKVESAIFHHNIMNIQDHSVVTLLHTNSMCTKTPQSEFTVE